MTIIPFDYQFVPGERYLLPICYPRLLGPKGDVVVRALADSGATFSVFLEAVAADAGIELPEIPNSSVRFGRSIIEGKRLAVDLAIRERRCRADVIFVARWDYSYSLLGRMGVWDQFKQVVFMERGPTPRLQFRY